MSSFQNSTCSDLFGSHHTHNPLAFPSPNVSALSSRPGEVPETRWRRNKAASYAAVPAAPPAPEAPPQPQAEPGVGGMPKEQRRRCLNQYCALGFFRIKKREDREVGRSIFDVILLVPIKLFEKSTKLI